MYNPLHHMKISKFGTSTFGHHQDTKQLEAHCRFIRRDEGPLQPSYQREQRWKRIPPLNETIEAMRGRDYLPAIWFIFSRAGCDKLARQAYASGARLTTPEEQATILALVTALK